MRASALRRAFLPIFERTVERYVVQEARAGQRALKKAFETDAPLVELERRLEEHYATFPDAVRRELRPALATFAGVACPALEAEAALVDAWTSAAAERHVARSRREIRMAVAASDPRAALEALFATWEASRAEPLARQEIIRAEAALEGEVLAAAEGFDTPEES